MYAERPIAEESFEDVSSPRHTPGSVEGAALDAVKILERRERHDWDYDEEADVLYLSVGKPRKATGVDIGQGVVIRYDEKKQEVVGLTILGVRARLVQSLKNASRPVLVDGWERATGRRQRAAGQRSRTREAAGRWQQAAGRRLGRNMGGERRQTDG